MKAVLWNALVTGVAAFALVLWLFWRFWIRRK